MGSKKLSLRIFQWVVALVAFFFILHRIEWVGAINVIKNADLRWTIAGFLLSLTAFVPASMRWVQLLNAVGIRFSLIPAYRIYLIGSFLGLALPGTISGDGARIWFCNQETEAGLPIVTAIVFAERVLGIVALFFLLSLGIFFHPVSEGIAFSAFAFASAGLGLLGMFLLPSIIRFLSRWSTHFTANHANWVGRLVYWFLLNLSLLRFIRVKQLLIALCYSMLFQLVDILVTIFISNALGFQITLTMLLFTMPIVYLATVLPISPGGLGVRESTLVIILGRFDILPSNAALFALAVFVNRFLLAMVGGIIYLSKYSIKNGRTHPQALK